MSARDSDQLLKAIVIVRYIYFCQGFTAFLRTMERVTRAFEAFADAVDWDALREALEDE